jgi:hypothetical protein
MDNIFRKYSSNKNKKHQALIEKMADCNFQTPENEASFIDITEKNIKNARFLLMIVGDGIREGVERMAEFLNSTPNMQYRLALVELEVYDLGKGERLVVPQLTTKTNIIERGIIRVENTCDKVSVEMYNETEEIPQKVTTRSNKLSMEEFISTTVGTTPKINGNDLNDLLSDIENLGFLVHLSSAGCNVSYRPNGMKEKIPMLHFYIKGIVYFLPIEICGKLEKLSFSTKIGEQFLEDIKPLLADEQKNKPYEYYEGIYHIDMDKAIENKETLLSALEDFANNL